MSNSEVPQSYTFHHSSPEFERLVTACTTVSNEAFTVSDLATVIQKQLSRLSAALKDAFRFMSTWDYSQPEVINSNQVASVLRRVQYTSMDDVRINIPVGFEGDLLAYVTEISNVQLDWLLDLQGSHLELTMRTFASFLNSPEDLADRRPEATGSAYTLAKLQELAKLEGKWTIPGNRRSEASFTEVFQNNDSCANAMAIVNRINELRWKKANPKAVAKATTDLATLANTLFSNIQKNESTVSKQVLAHLAQELEVAARWVEWYSVMCTRIIDTTTALKLTEKKLLRAL